MSETQTSDDNHVVSIDEYRHLTLQDLLREWAESARGPDWCPAGAAGRQTGQRPGGGAAALNGTLIVDGFKWVRRKLPRGEGA